ncbi:hypothetical protein CL617_04600 [archaeon]|nr:hypothetical protein [archaeon]|tara:strand:+ start:6914 stop:7531 length:618 start_codon:yes stop_codon:yes gene_type:complete
MAITDIAIPQIGITEWLKIGFLLFLGVFLGYLIKVIIKKIAKINIYPWVRKTSPGLYKRTVSGVNLVADVVQWVIILMFFLQALSAFKIYLLDEILRLSINFVPKLAIAFFIIVIGLIITNVLSRKIRSIEFNHNNLLAKFLEIVFIYATILSALEAIGVKVTPFLEIFRVGLYTLGLILAIAVGVALSSSLKPLIEKVLNEKKK